MSNWSAFEVKTKAAYWNDFFFPLLKAGPGCIKYELLSFFLHTPNQDMPSGSNIFFVVVAADYSMRKCRPCYWAVLAILRNHRGPVGFLKIGSSSYSLRDASHQARLGEAGQGQVLCAALGWGSAAVAPVCQSTLFLSSDYQEELGITGQTAQSCRKPGFGSCVVICFCSCLLFCWLSLRRLKTGWNTVFLSILAVINFGCFTRGCLLSGTLLRFWNAV